MTNVSVIESSARNGVEIITERECDEPCNEIVAALRGALLNLSGALDDL